MAPWVAGLALPAVITILVLIFRRQPLAGVWMAVFLCGVLNLSYAIFQGIVGWGEGQRLLPAFLYVVLSRSERGTSLSPTEAFAGGWLSLFPGDVIGAFAEPLLQGREEPLPLSVLGRVGGAGWIDALLVYPLFCAFLAVALKFLGGASQRHQSKKGSINPTN